MGSHDVRVLFMHYYITSIWPDDDPITGRNMLPIRRKTKYMHLLYLPLFISTCWLLHVSAVACHHQGAIVSS
jgi:hypothetical protein